MTMDVRRQRHSAGVHAVAEWRVTPVASLWSWEDLGLNPGAVPSGLGDLRKVTHCLRASVSRNGVVSNKRLPGTS